MIVLDGDISVRQILVGDEAGEVTVFTGSPWFLKVSGGMVAGT
jgi:hypothetical protein